MDLDKDSLIFHRAGTSPLEDVRPSFWECLALKCASGEFYLDCSAETGRDEREVVWKVGGRNFAAGNISDAARVSLEEELEMDIWNNWSSVQRGLKIFEQSKLLGHFNEQEEGYLDFSQCVKERSFYRRKLGEKLEETMPSWGYSFFFRFIPIIRSVAKTYKASSKCE